VKRKIILTIKTKKINHFRIVDSDSDEEINNRLRTPLTTRLATPKVKEIYYLIIFIFNFGGDKTSSTKNT
jgi:hypothetical protein